MKKQSISPSFSLTELEVFQDARGGAGIAASANFAQDEVTRLKRKYATLLDTYHRVQMADTEGVYSVTLNSPTQQVTVFHLDIEIFTSITEKLVDQLGGLERQIIAMSIDLPNQQDNYGAPEPETNAIMAACLPPETPQATAERCPFLPDQSYKAALATR